MRSIHFYLTTGLIALAGTGFAQISSVSNSFDFRESVGSSWEAYSAHRQGDWGTINEGYEDSDNSLQFLHEVKAVQNTATSLQIDGTFSTYASVTNSASWHSFVNGQDFCLVAIDSTQWISLSVSNYSLTGIGSISRPQNSFMIGRVGSGWLPISWNGGTASQCFFDGDFTYRALMSPGTYELYTTLNAFTGSNGFGPSVCDTEFSYSFRAGRAAEPVPEPATFAFWVVVAPFVLRQTTRRHQEAPFG